MIDPAWLLSQQKVQFIHDEKYHQDIFCLPRNDRLKHYGLHYAKYCGRFARDGFEHGLTKTVSDFFLVALSAANALSDNLLNSGIEIKALPQSAAFLPLCDATGRFADACEKIDHAERFIDIAVPANRDIISALGGLASAEKLELEELLNSRRSELRLRAFYR